MLNDRIDSAGSHWHAFFFVVVETAKRTVNSNRFGSIKHGVITTNSCFGF